MSWTFALSSIQSQVPTFEGSDQRCFELQTSNFRYSILFTGNCASITRSVSRVYQQDDEPPTHLICRLVNTPFKLGGTSFVCHQVKTPVLVLCLALTNKVSFIQAPERYKRPTTARNIVDILANATTSENSYHHGS